MKELRILRTQNPEFPGLYPESPDPKQAPMISLWPKHSQLLTYHPPPPAHTAQNICHLGPDTLSMPSLSLPADSPRASPSALARPSAVSPAGRRLVPRRRPAISPPTASARTPGARCPGAHARRPRRAGGSRRAAQGRTSTCAEQLSKKARSQPVNQGAPRFRGGRRQRRAH